MMENVTSGLVDLSNKKAVGLVVAGYVEFAAGRTQRSALRTSQFLLQPVFLWPYLTIWARLSGK